jgi:Tol biopolymer transport system component
MNIKKIIPQLLCLITNLFFFSTMAQSLLPIQPSRTISFITTEGSYMDVDTSPDGSKIVFDLLGDIYTLPSSGGKAKQVTKGLAWNRYPIWSPDGKEIAFISDVSGANHINIMHTDGTFKRTVDKSEPQIVYHPQYNYDEGTPLWTPHGDYIIEHNRLHHITGGYISLPASIKKIIGFSRDEQLVYYCDSDVVKQYNRRTGGNNQVMKLPKNYCNVQISPDLKWLIYITGPALESNMVIHNLATSKEKILVRRIEHHYRRMEEHYAFTTDSRYVLAGFNGKIHKIDVACGSDHEIPFSAHVNVEMGSFNYNTFKTAQDSFQVRYTRSANESPDGHSLVFSALNQLYIMSIPGGEPHVLAEQPLGQFQPTYSPDGKWIAYVTRDDTEGGAIWRVPSNGGDAEKISSSDTPFIYSEPTWSPDGNHLAYIKQNQTVAGIFGGIGSGILGSVEIISLKNKDIQKVAYGIPVQNRLSFSADGRRLLFKPRESHSWHQSLLMSLKIDDKKTQVLCVQSDTIDHLLKPDFTQQQKITISPDNRYKVMAIDENLYLSPLFSEPMIANPSMVGTPPLIQFSDRCMDLHWENGGKTFCWSYGNQFYRIDPDKIVAKAVQVTKDSARFGLGDSGVLKVQVIPDEAITMNIKVPMYYAHGTIVLQDVRIISMKGNQVIEHGIIVITNGRFTAVGPINSVHIPFGAKIIDLNGKTIIPGLVDLHNHISESNDIFQQQSWIFLVNLAYGVTTIRDPSLNSDSFGYAEMLETGKMTGPRLFSVGWSVRHPLLSFDEARSIVQKRAALGAICIKQYTQPTRLQKQWLLMACREAKLNMTNEGDYDLKSTLAMMKDGSTGVEHTAVYGNIFEDVIKFISEAGTWHTPTLQVSRGGEEGAIYFRNLFQQHPDTKVKNYWPSNLYIGRTAQKTFTNDTLGRDFVYSSSIDSRIFQQGGHIAMGAHGEDQGIGSHWELWALKMGGLSNLEALQTATINGAKALGIQSDLGSIEVGKLADLIVLDKNPLEDIHNSTSILYVMKGGELFDGNTLNTIWPVKKKLPEWRFFGSKISDKKK